MTLTVNGEAVVVEPEVLEKLLEVAPEMFDAGLPEGVDEAEFLRLIHETAARTLAKRRSVSAMVTAEGVAAYAASFEAAAEGARGRAKVLVGQRRRAAKAGQASRSSALARPNALSDAELDAAVARRLTDGDGRQKSARSLYGELMSSPISVSWPRLLVSVKRVKAMRAK